MGQKSVVVDATVFLGMHHASAELRQRALGFFRACFQRPVGMNYEQIGLCHAVIGQRPREVQDLYYPFMHRLHREMQFVCGGYRRSELDFAREYPELAALRPEQALLAASIVVRSAELATLDPVLRALPCLRSRLWRFDATPEAFPAELEALYETSLAFVHVPSAPGAPGP